MSFTRRNSRALTRAVSNGWAGAPSCLGIDRGHVEQNSLRGVRRFADTQKKALLTGDQDRALADAHALEQNVIAAAHLGTSPPFVSLR
jgi:hypothetical protein